MPTDPGQFQIARLPWSRWKHEILLDYLKAMSAVLRSRSVIYYVDGFAGPGRYIEDEVDGSPLLAARHARKLASSGTDYALKCINVESDPDVFQNLQDSTSDFSAHTENLHGEFGLHVTDIVRKVADKPALFFLDPIGVKGLEWHTLLPLFQRKWTTELLIRFDAQTATRLTGNDATLHGTFNSILGEDNSQYWNRYLRDPALAPNDKKSRLTKAYENKLKNHFDFVTRIPIRSSDNQIKYFLLFATRNLAGVRVMNDTLNKIENLRHRTLEEERRQQNSFQQMDLFSSGIFDYVELDLLALKTSLLNTMERGKPVIRGDLRAMIAIVDDNFGRYSRSHFTAVLGGRPTGITVPEGFESLKSRIEIHNGKTVGDDKVKISLRR